MYHIICVSVVRWSMDSFGERWIGEDGVWAFGIDWVLRDSIAI